MSNLPRYKMKCVYDNEQGTHIAVPRIRQEGEWVKFKDHLESLSTAYSKQSAPCISCNIVTTNIVRLCKSCEGNFE